MKIWGYQITFGDDQDTLADSLNSMSFCDKVYLVDGGFGNALCHTPRHTSSVAEWLGLAAGYEDGRTFRTTFNGIPLCIVERHYNDPGDQRNWALKYMLQEENQPDWIFMLDSDEVCSNELIGEIRPFLESLKENQTNVIMPWLTLVQDENHCVDHMSQWLSHGRAMRPGKTYFNNGYHEHQYYDGERVKFNGRIVHLRAFYRNRLLTQRGHPTINGRDRPLWGDARMVNLPNGVTWPKLHYPENEIVPFPFEKNALEVWDEQGNLRKNN
jgi:hypothetical protein